MSAGMTYSLPTGRPRANRSSSTPSRRDCGCSLSVSTRKRGSSHPRDSTRATPRSRPTGAGWRTARLAPVVRRSTSGHFRRKSRNTRSRAQADSFHDGAGNEIFFVDPGGVLMAARFDGSQSPPAMIPQPLFPAGLAAALHNHPYDVSHDGRRFLILYRLTRSSVRRLPSSPTGRPGCQDSDRAQTRCRTDFSPGAVSLTGSMTVALRFLRLLDRQSRFDPWSQSDAQSDLRPLPRGPGSVAG